MRRPLAGLLGVLLLSACSAEGINGPDEGATELMAVAPPAQVSGAILGPDGTSLCNFLPAATPIRVRLLDPDQTPLVGGNQIIACPNNLYSMVVAADTYHVIVDALTPNLGALPFRWLDPVPLDNSAGAVVRDEQLLEGQPLTGSVTRDGVPFAGLFSNVTYGQFSNVLAASLITDLSGAWTEAIGRTPPLFQGGQSYRFNCPSTMLGSRAVTTIPTGPVTFPGGISSLDCTFTASSEIAYTHSASRLLLTAMPGDVGGLNGGLTAGVSLGWGVQFPLAQGGDPAIGEIGLSELYRGGLVLALAPDRMLTGYSARGFHQCGGPAQDACVDFTARHAGHVAHQGATGRKITWTMNDEGSPEGVGMEVRQRSYDRGGQGGDFVWFEYRLNNTSKSSQTLYAGFWGDWDIGDDAFDDFGTTALGGRLMYFHNEDGTGPYLGTLIVGPAPVAGTAAYVDQQNGPGSASTARQYELASGAVTFPTTLISGDQRSYHTIGPITLAKKAKATFWVAIVAGETESELLANAEAALAARPVSDD